MTGSARSATTLAQKRALRLQAQQNPTVSKKCLQAWFQQAFGQYIAPPSVSEILSFRYDYLDEDKRDNSLRRKKNRREKWPELEKQLASWIIPMIQQRRQEAEKGGDEGRLKSARAVTIPGRLIREKARFFWQCIPEYRGEEIPSFSNCWIQRFRQRCEERLWRQEQVDVRGTASPEIGQSEYQAVDSWCFNDNDNLTEYSGEESIGPESSQPDDEDLLDGVEVWEFDDITNSNWEGFAYPTSIRQ